MGWGTLTTSQRITARAELLTAADNLADAVDRHLDPRYGLLAVSDALIRYRAARDEARR